MTNPPWRTPDKMAEAQTRGLTDRTREAVANIFFVESGLYWQLVRQPCGPCYYPLVPLWASQHLRQQKRNQTGPVWVPAFPLLP